MKIEEDVRAGLRAVLVNAQGAGRPRVVLLQGPVGPFFRRLHRYLERRGFEVLRICFDAGDRHHARGTRSLLYSKGRENWQAWFAELLLEAKPEHLVFFGSGREIHRIARHAAEAAGVNVISLEEGYIRPGYITVERGGNNAASPVAGLMPPDDFKVQPARKRRTDFRGFGRMCFNGFVHYTIRSFFSKRIHRELFHRTFYLPREIFAWVRNYWRRIAHLRRNFSTIEKLLEHHHAQYFIVPLQVAADSQLGSAALGWDSGQLIDQSLASFAKHAAPSQRLVFKIHPMERGHSADERRIRSAAQRLGIAGRVDVIDTGSLGLLTRHSAGMVTINSTSGLSAIAHGVPLLVIGDALYANDQLAVCAQGQPDFDAFWQGAPVADAVLRSRYLAWIKASCLKCGDFYAPKGMGLACQGILEVMRRHARTLPERVPAAASRGGERQETNSLECLA